MPDSMSPDDHLRMLRYYPPELVEVVYQPAACADLIREIARMRCEADEALEAIVAWRNLYLWYDTQARLKPRDPTIEKLIRTLDHVIDHIRWIQDPKA